MIQHLLQQQPDITAFLVAAVSAVAAITIHEVAHALAARSRGDPTPRLAGRLTLNPRVHLDPVGSFFLLLMGFGWGKPVSVAPNKIRGGKSGRVVVALAGPLANIAMAFLAGLALAAAGPGASPRLEYLVLIPFSMNILIAIFNLLPVPPLDGYPILEQFLPPRRREVLVFLERWSFVILLVVGFLLFRPLVAPFADVLAAVLLDIAGA